MKYDPTSWEKYSKMGVQHALESTWFSRYRGAMDLDRYIRTLFAKPKIKKDSLRRIAIKPDFTERLGPAARERLRRKRQEKKLREVKNTE